MAESQSRAPLLGVHNIMMPAELPSRVLYRQFCMRNFFNRVSLSLALMSRRTPNCGISCQGML